MPRIIFIRKENQDLKVMRLRMFCLSMGVLEICCHIHIINMDSNTVFMRIGTYICHIFFLFHIFILPCFAEQNATAIAGAEDFPPCFAYLSFKFYPSLFEGKRQHFMQRCRDFAFNFFIYAFL